MSTEDDRGIVIIGGGLAAAKAAEEIREQGYTGPLSVIAEEPFRPYERPPLSKGRLAGTAEPDEIYVHDAGWYADHNVDLRTGVTATSVDPAARRVSTSDGDIDYSKLLLATGSVARTLPDISGSNVFTLRTVADSEALQAQLAAGGRRVVLVGAGWIGLEVAATARTLGNQVTVIAPESVPLARAVGTEMGEMFAGLHREHGVDLRLGVSVVGTEVADGAVTAVRTGTGDTVPADLVVVGIGAAPRLELAESAGLATGSGGVLVDAALRTSDPNIWAAGDIAAIDHPLLGRIRVEHWGNALATGQAAGKSMTGRVVTFDTLPYFFTDQYDLGMEFTGNPGASDRVVVRGDLAGREFIAFYVADGRITAAMNVNVWDVTDNFIELIRSGAQVSDEALADPNVPLDQLGH